MRIAKMSAMMNQDKLKALVAELAKDIKTEKDLGALTQQLVKLTVETALNAELGEHLGYDKHDPAGRGSGNSRNTVRKYLASGITELTQSPRQSPSKRPPKSSLAARRVELH
jgi:hypothetical protein